MGNEKKKKEGPHFGDEADALAGLEFGRGEGLDAHAVAPVHVLVAVGGRPRDYLEAVQVDEDAAADGRRPLVVVLGGAEDREAAGALREAHLAPPRVERVRVEILGGREGAVVAVVG
jgi:hypothetical protein